MTNFSKEEVNSAAVEDRDRAEAQDARQCFDLSRVQGCLGWSWVV